MIRGRFDAGKIERGSRRLGEDPARRGMGERRFSDAFRAGQQPGMMQFA